MTTIIEQIKAARKVSTPLIAITTPDPPATVAGVVKGFNGQAPAILQHDIIRGVVGLNDKGKAVRARMANENDLGLPGVVPFQNPTEALAKFAELEERTLVFVHNAARLIEDPGVIQAICNLRDLFKSDGRTLVLLSPQISLPAELTQDVLTIDEPLPDDAQIRSIIENEVDNAKAIKNAAPPPDAETVTNAVEALSGLAAFPAEQAVAMSLAAGPLNVPALWARKRAFIQQTRGLSIDRESLTFADLGGLANAKDFGAKLFAGRKPPRAIVRIDEIEKMLGGAAGDTSGVSQDALGTILREMEDQEWAGLIAVGPPGSGKSAYSKSLGATHGKPTFALDLGATKGSLVGQSEQNIRQALKVVRAVAADGAFFVATCNKLDALPPELRRRFRYGLWFFDLPTKEERANIWTITLARFELPADMERPNDEGWTGAEIRNVVELAWRMRCSLAEAARFIVPVSVSDPGSIDKLRTLAHSKFLSASNPGVYVHAKAPNAAPALATGRSYGKDE